MEINLSNTETLMQWVILPAIVCVVLWIARQLWAIVKARLELTNTVMFQDISDAFHSKLLLQIADMVATHALNLDLNDPQQIKDNLAQLRQRVLFGLRKYLENSKWGAMGKYASSYIDDDDDYLVQLIDRAIVQYVDGLIKRAIVDGLIKRKGDE